MDANLILQRIQLDLNDISILLRDRDLPGVIPQTDLDQLKSKLDDLQQQFDGVLAAEELKPLLDRSAARITRLKAIAAEDKNRK